MKSIFPLVVICIVAVSSVAAFTTVVPSDKIVARSVSNVLSGGHVRQGVDHPVVRMDRSVLGMVKGGKKKAIVVEETDSEIDYGKALLLFVDPRNPYSWFVYMFGFITIYGAVSGN